MGTTLRLAYSELITEIHRLSSEKRTGTIFITSDDSHFMRIVLNDGEIICLVFDVKHRGYDAISRIQTIKSGKLQFVEGTFKTTQEISLPSTEEIFHKLYEDDDISTTQVPSNIEAIIKYIKKRLAIHIGPIAIILCDEYIEKVGTLETVGDVFAMLEVIAPEIENVKEQEKFKEKVKNDVIKIVGLS
jgi:hypothetical protein